MSAQTPDPDRRTGLWVVGARGAIATSLAYGLGGLCEGLLEPVGMATARPPIARLPLAPLEGFVLGGHDVCRRDVSRSAGELVAGGVLPADLVAVCASRAAAYEAAIRPGLLDGPDVGIADLDPRASERGSAAPREQIETVQRDWDEFEERAQLERTVVVYLASAEAGRRPQPEWEGRAAFERALDAGREQPASMLYAYAALSSGRPFVNFTPNLGAGVPALLELAEERNVPHCGNDGKTGETLVKTALAPMFAARALRVLSWQGYNMLGNRDGQVLCEETHRRAKIANKDAALRSILGDMPGLHTQVGIDYVPSLGDWKTAWDFVHFEGFFGAKMSLAFTWSGCDSALATPLALDLARLTELAAALGEGGVQTHTACYFKDPIGGGTHDFHAQYERLVRYAKERS